MLYDFFLHVAAALTVGSCQLAGEAVKCYCIFVFLWAFYVTPPHHRQRKLLPISLNMAKCLAAAAALSKVIMSFAFLCFNYSVARAC
jgi:hypothetical protein